MASGANLEEVERRLNSDALCDVCVSQILDCLAGVDLCRLEVASRRWMSACASAWSVAFDRRYGKECVVSSKREERIDYRREYAFAARGDPELLSWRASSHVDGVYRCRSRPPAACGTEQGAAIFGEFWRGDRYEVGIVFIASDSWSFVEAPFSARDGADLRSLDGGRDVLVHGGCLADSGARVAESWMLIGRREWRRIEAPYDTFSTVHHSCDVVDSSGLVVRFGGQRWDGEPLDDCIVFDRVCGRKVTSFPHPPARALHASCVVEDDKLLVAGGIRADGVGTLHDAWLLECRDSWTWTRVALGEDDDGSMKRATRGWAVVKGAGRALGGSPLALTAEYNVAFGLWRCELHHSDGTLFLCGDGGVATFALDTKSTPRIDGRLVPVAKNFVTVVDSPPSRPAPLLDAAHVLFGKSILVSFGGNDGDSDQSWYNIAGHTTDRAAFVDLGRNRNAAAKLSGRRTSRSSSSSSASLDASRRKNKRGAGVGIGTGTATRRSGWRQIPSRKQSSSVLFSTTQQQQQQHLAAPLSCHHFAVVNKHQRQPGLLVVSLHDQDGRIEIDHLEWRPHKASGGRRKK